MISSFFSYSILLLFLLLLSAFFSGSETSFFSLSRSQLACFKKSGEPQAKMLLQFLSKPRDILVTLLFGNELTNIAISVFIAGFIYKIMGPENYETSAFVSVTVGTAIVLIFGEILPKNFAIIHASTLAPFLAYLLKPLYAILKPLRHILVAFSEWIIAKFGGELRRESPLIVEEEFRYLLELGASTGQVAEEEKEMIHKVFEFGEKIVSNIMIPMGLVFCLPVDMPYEELLKQIRETHFSRIPIYEGSSDKIIGLLYVKDLFSFDRRWKKDNNLSIRDILRPPLFVSHKKRLEDLLQEFRQTKIHMAISVNEKNRPLGVITIHDALQELFGEVEE